MKKLSCIFAHIILSLMVSCAPAHADPSPTYPYGSASNMCNIPENDDSWSLEPSETVSGEYVFTYINNLSQCSDNFEALGVTASDGFRIIMKVEAGINEAGDERITVWPEDPQYMAYPPELVVPDSSETYEIRLIPGMS